MVMIVPVVAARGGHAAEQQQRHQRKSFHSRASFPERIAAAKV